MCFIIHPDHPCIEYCKENIEVYKVVEKKKNGVFKSTIYDEKYVIGKITKVKKFGRRANILIDSIDEGIHLYSNLRKAYSCCIREWGQTIIKGIIPKNVGHYYNPDELQYVSLKFKPLKHLTNRDCIKLLKIKK